MSDVSEDLEEYHRRKHGHCIILQRRVDRSGWNEDRRWGEMWKLYWGYRMLYRYTLPFTLIDGYPHCVFCEYRYRYSLDRVECHIDPTINKASTGKERTVRPCSTSTNTDKSTGQPIFNDLAWFAYKVSGVMCSTSACDHSWSIEEWIHSKRRNTLSQELVERLLYTHTNLVLRESLDASLHHLLPWDIDLTIDEPEPEHEVCQKV